MFSSKPFPSKEAFIAAVESGESIKVCSLGLRQPVLNGIEYVSGRMEEPEYSWFAQVFIKEGRVVSVK